MLVILGATPLDSFHSLRSFFFFSFHFYSVSSVFKRLDRLARYVQLHVSLLHYRIFERTLS